MRNKLKLKWGTLRGMLGRPGVSSDAHTVDLLSARDVVAWVHWGGYGECVRFRIPVENAVMQGGVSFSSPKHHFRAALEHGKDALAGFYQRVQPRSLVEWHGIEPARPEDSHIPAWEVPWIQRPTRSPPPGEGGLSAAEGISFYGPVSLRKVELEYSKLITVRKSIERHGYRPDLYGDIDGYFMLNDDGDYRFFVRGGKHRAAVLASLGQTWMPVSFKRDWPRAVRLSDSRNWPMVLSGHISESVAREVFTNYFL